MDETEDLHSHQPPPPLVYSNTWGKRPPTKHWRKGEDFLQISWCDHLNLEALRYHFPRDITTTFGNPIAPEPKLKNAHTTLFPSPLGNLNLLT